MASIDYLVVVVYLAVSLAVGFWFVRRASRSTNEFFISGRNLPWWLAGTSMVATSFAADTPLYVVGLTLAAGISGNWQWWSFAAGGMFSVFLLSRLWRRAAVVTDVELTELRYAGEPAAALRGIRAAYLALPVNCISMAWVILGFVKIAEVLFGWHPLISTGVCAALTLSYCVVSGFWGVVVTDFLQFIVAMVGSIVLCVLAVGEAGGLGAIASAASTEVRAGASLLAFFPSVPSLSSVLTRDFWETGFAAFMVFVFVQWWANKNADGGGDVVQRMLAAKNERHAMLASFWFNIANYALRPWPWILVALAALVLIPGVNQMKPEDLEYVYPMMIRDYVPAGLMGLLVASLIGAFMSTIDTKLNLGSAYLVNDVYRRFIRRDASEKHYIAVSRLASVALMLIASGIALTFNSIRGLFTFLLSFSSGFGIVHLLRWFWWRVNAWSEISAIVATAVIATVLQLLSGVLGLTGQGVLFFTVVGSAAVWVPVTFLTAPVERGRLIAFYRKVRPYGAWGPVAREAGVPPARGLAWLLVVWVAGTVMVLGATFAIGKFLLMEPVAGWLWLTAAYSGMLVVALEVFRRRAPAEGPHDVA
ncbi:MAG TPA: sodium:solute symporter family protein [Planctomycetota bacterium]|nr:sodium:solute symporter family protein [Planctomycetota bacterium]